MTIKTNFEIAIHQDLKRIYQSVNIEEAKDELTAFSDKWDSKYTAISRMWGGAV